MLFGHHLLAILDDEAFVNHGVGSSNHFQEPAALTMIHYCFHSHFIYLDK